MYLKKLLGWLPGHPRIRALLALFFASGVFLTISRNEIVAHWHAADEVDEDSASGAASANTNVQTGKKGPWGEIVAEKLSLENYDDMFPKGSGQLQPPQWIFDRYTKEQLLALLQTVPLSREESAVLTDTNRWLLFTNGIVIKPPEELIAGLSKESRQVLYPVLARTPFNFPQCLCYRMPLEGFDEEFAGSGIPAAKLEILRAMTYTNEGTLCLAVDRSVQRYLTDAEFSEMIRSLFSVKAWRVSLRVTPDSDIEALVKYWGKGGRERTIRPLLESIARQPNGGRLNISYFLPPFARMRLYTYPYAYSASNLTDEDCFFTARYFFRQEISTPTESDLAKSAARLLANCERTDDPPEFGDVLLLLDRDEKPIHVCIYLADDFVYTKNGNGISKPWVIMKIDEMMEDYITSKPLRIAHLRPKT